MYFFSLYNAKGLERKEGVGESLMILTRFLWTLPYGTNQPHAKGFKKSTVPEITWNTDGTVQQNSTGRLRDILRKQSMAARKKRRSFGKGMHMNIWH